MYSTETISTSYLGFGVSLRHEIWWWFSSSHDVCLLFDVWQTVNLIIRRNHSVRTCRELFQFKCENSFPGMEMPEGLAVNASVASGRNISVSKIAVNWCFKLFENVLQEIHNFNYCICSNIVRNCELVLETLVTGRSALRNSLKQGLLESEIYHLKTV